MAAAVGKLIALAAVLDAQPVPTEGRQVWDRLEVEAQMLYDECPTVKPTWDQLGETTKSVWKDMVLAGKRARLW